MTKTLKEEAISGVKWTTINYVGRFFITFFLSIILARILTPVEFGITAMVSIFIAIATVFINSGLSSALIRDHSSTDEDFSTAFYFNMLISLVFYCLLFFFAPLIAHFYNEPVLINVTRLISLVFVFNAFGLVQNARLVQALNFKLQTICNLTGLFISAIIGIVMAYEGYGVYSIVGQTITQALFTNIMFWFTSSWRPIYKFSKSSFKKLWKFGSKILMTSIFIEVIDQVDNLFIGKLFQANTLGLYSRGKSSSSIVHSFFNGVVGNVSFSLLAKVSKDRNELNRVHLKLFGIVLFIIAPISVGLFISSDSFILTLYGEKWQSAIIFLKIISIGIIPDILSTLFSHSMIAAGFASMYMNVNISKKSISLLALIVGFYFGIVPFTITFIALKYFGLLIDIYFYAKSTKVQTITYVKELIRVGIPLALMLVTLLISESYLAQTPWVKLIELCSIGFVTYSVFSYFWNRRDFYYLMQIVKEKIGRK